MNLTDESIKELESEFGLGTYVNLSKTYKPNKKVYAGERKVK